MTQSVVLDKQVVEKSKMVACNILDKEARKRTYALNIAANAVAKYINTEFGIEVDTKYSLFRISSFVRSFEIADIYVDGLRLDVRVSFDGKTFSVPKVHAKYNVNPLAYLVVSLDETLENIEILGFVAQKDLENKKSDTDYICYSTDVLSSMQEFKSFVSEIHFVPQIFPVADHEKIKELAVSFVDDDITASEKVYFIKHVLECPVCRELFCDINDFDVIVSQLKNYEELLSDSTLSFLSGNQEEIADASIAQIATLPNENVGDATLEEDTSFSANNSKMIDDVISDISNISVEENDVVQLEEVEQFTLNQDAEIVENINEDNVAELEIAQNQEIENHLVSSDENESSDELDFEVVDGGADVVSNIDLDSKIDMISDVDNEVPMPDFDDKLVLKEENLAIDELSFEDIENTVSDVTLLNEIETSELLGVEEESTINHSDVLLEQPQELDELDLNAENPVVEELESVEEYSKPMGVVFDDIPNDNIQQTVSFNQEEDLHIGDTSIILEHDEDDILLEELHEIDNLTDHEISFAHDEKIIGVEEIELHDNLLDLPEYHDNLLSIDDAVEHTTDIELDLSNEKPEDVVRPQVLEDTNSELGLEDLETLDIIQETENNALENIVSAVNADEGLLDNLTGNEQSEFVIQPSQQEPIELVYDEEDEEDEEENVNVEIDDNEESGQQELSQEEKDVVKSDNNQSSVDGEIQSLLDDDLLALLCNDEQSSANEDTSVFTSVQSDDNENLKLNTSALVEKSLDENLAQQTVAQNQQPAVANIQDVSEHSFQAVSQQTENVETLFNNDVAPNQNVSSNFHLENEPISQKTMNTTKRILIMLVFLFVLASGGIITWFANNQKNNQADNMFDTNKNDEFFDIQNNVKKQNDVMPAISQDINKSMTNSFSDKPAAVTITKLSWQVSEKLAAETSVKEYLQIAGKNIQLNLQNDLANSADINFNNLVKVSMVIAPDNTLKDLQIVESSGSDQIDEIVSRSLKNTLKQVQVPKLKDNKLDYLLTLVINF